MQVLELCGDCPLSALPPPVLSSHVEDLTLQVGLAQGVAGQLPEWTRLQSLNLKLDWCERASQLCTLLQGLAGTTQLRSMTCVLPKGREAETRPHCELGRAMARLHAERPQLQLRLVLE